MRLRGVRFFFLLILSISVLGLLIFFVCMESLYPTTSSSLSQEIASSFDSAKKLKKNRIDLENSESLNPVENENFLVISWFKIQKLPRNGERIVLYSKYDVEHEKIPGYAVAIERQGKKIIPYVYFNNENDNGRWFRFSEVEIVQKVWFMVALSFTDNRFLGLHIASLHSLTKDKIRLLGGYDLSGKIIPSSKTNFLVGGNGNYAFNGAVGPVGVFSGFLIKNSLNDLYLKFLSNPLEIPEELDRAVRYWYFQPDSDLKKSSSS